MKIIETAIILQRDKKEALKNVKDVLQSLLDEDYVRLNTIPNDGYEGKTCLSDSPTLPFSADGVHSSQQSMNLSDEEDKKSSSIGNIDR